MEYPKEKITTNFNLIPVILSGGSGTRLWPLSRACFPKQYLNLLNNNDKTLLQNTILRLEGLKTQLIRVIKSQVKSTLNETDWYITRKAEKSTAIPSAITTHRDAVRTKQAAMETAITNAADTAALETLYARDSNGDRPLGDIPTLE